MSVPFTKEEMVKLLGSLDEHDDDMNELPEPLKYAYFSKMFIWQPGMRDHGWAAGVYPSPYPDDHDFVLVVLHCRSALRMSKYTPSSVLDFLGPIGASLRELDFINNDYMELDDGVSELAKNLGDMWRKFRSNSRGGGEPHSMSAAGQEFIGALILAFSHEARPALAPSIIMRTVGLVQIEAARADEKASNFHGDWSLALEIAVSEEARSYPTWRGQRGLKASPFKKTCATFIAGYMEKLSPGFSVHYTMDPVVAQEGIGSDWLGEATMWSAGLLVPYLDQHLGKVKIQGMMRNMWWVDYDGYKQRLPEDALTVNFVCRSHLIIL